MRTAIIALIFIIILQNTVSSNEEKLLNSLKLIGSGKLKVFMWDIYDVQLLSAEEPFSRNNSLILIFDHKRNLSKEKIVESSLTEIKKQNVADENMILNWRSVLQRCIQPVQKGSKPSVHWTPEGKITFFYENTKSCSVNNKQFSNAFIDIWLGKNTSRPKLREELLGITKP